MTSKLILATTLALVFGSNAFAQQADNIPSPAAKTRAQVVEELKQAQANGRGMPSGFIAFHAPDTRELPAAQDTQPKKTASSK